VREHDWVVADACGKAYEAAIALAFSLPLLKPREGTAILIADAPEGQIPHCGMRARGSECGGRHYQPRRPGSLKRRLKKRVLLAPHADRTMLDLICPIDEAVVFKTWPQALQILGEDFPAEAWGAVIPDGTMPFLQSCGERAFPFR